MIVLKIAYMIIDYTITNKMISSVTSISEKIGRIKEIRSANKHIDFDLLCNARNMYEVANRKNLNYSEVEIVNILKKKTTEDVDIDNYQFRKFKDIFSMYAKLDHYKAYSIESFLKASVSLSVKHNKENDLNLIFKALADQRYFFLYRIAEFCYNGYDYICDDEIVQLWLIVLFYHEHGFVLYLSYADIMEKQYGINKLGKYYDEDLDTKSKNEGSIYPFYEFYLSVIDQALDKSIEFHYKLIHPVLDRVEMLKGVIKEPFSRKDYMEYHKIASATASLDLKKAVEKGILTIEGDKRNARYCFKDETDVVFL